MDFNTMMPIKNEFLNSDGSTVDVQGNVLKGPDANRAKLYSSMMSFKNEFLNADGSTSLVVGGDTSSGGVSATINGVVVSGAKSGADYKLVDAPTGDGTLFFANDGKYKEIEVPSTFNVKVRVDTVNDLPTNAEIGDAYFVGTLDTTNRLFYYWNGNDWILLGNTNTNIDTAQISSVVGELIKSTSPDLENKYPLTLKNDGRKIYESEYKKLFDILAEPSIVEDNATGNDEYNIPVIMTSANTPVPYVASSKAGYYDNNVGYAPFNAIKITPSTGSTGHYLTPRNNPSGDIVLDFGEKTILSGLSFINNRATEVNATPKNIEIYGSDDGTNFEIINTYQTPSNATMVWHNISFLSNKNYRYYQLKILSNYGQTFSIISAIKFYYREDLISTRYKILPNIPVDLNGYYSYTCADDNVFGVVSGTRSVNEIVPDENGDIIIYANNIKINSTNDTDIETELEILRLEKLPQKDFKVKNALDVANIDDAEIGLMAHINGNFQIGGLVKEVITVPEIIELQLSDNIVFTNQSVDAVIPFDIELTRGTKLIADGFGIRFNDTLIDTDGYARLTVNMTAANPSYPITVDVGVIIDGVKTSNKVSYTFTKDDNILFSLNSKNDAVPVGAGQKVEFYVSTNKALTAKDSLVILKHSFVRVSDRGVNDTGLKIERDFIQKSRISLKNSLASTQVGNTHEFVNFTGLTQPIDGTAFEWEILEPGKVKIKRNCVVNIAYAEQFTHSTNANGIVELKVFINGVFQQNYFRRAVVNLSTTPLPVVFTGISIKLNEGDVLQVSTADTSSNGNTYRVTDTNHVGSLLIIDEV